MRLIDEVYRRHKAPFFGLAPAELTEQDLDDWSELLYDTCTLCGRCTMVCPMGINIASVVRKSRAGLVAADKVPEGLLAAAERAIEQGSPLIKPGVLEKVVAKQAEEVDIPIELDKKGADYLVILSAMEILNFYEVIGALAKIFKQAGMSWTISSTAFEATNIGYQMGLPEIARTLVKRIVDSAKELEVKYFISPECGHAYTALNWEGPNMVGERYPFKVIHIVELLQQLRTEGRIKTKGLDGRRTTYHDPCQLSRRGGVVSQPRSLIGQVASDFIEMRKHGTANICCGGGGGVSSNPRAEEMRLKALACKKDQIDEIGGVEVLVTACANCRNVLEEAVDEYEMDLPIVGLTELVAMYLDEGGKKTKKALAKKRKKAA
jgi:Fe-S oxidoreductase